MRLGLKGRIAKTFDQVFVGDVGDAVWRSQNGRVIEGMTGGLDVSAHNFYYQPILFCRAGVGK